MNSYLNEIEDLLLGETPRQKYEWVKKQLDDFNKAMGRLDYASRQCKIIRDNPATDPYTKGYIQHVINQLDSPL